MAYNRHLDWRFCLDEYSAVARGEQSFVVAMGIENHNTTFLGNVERKR